MAAWSLRDASVKEEAKQQRRLEPSKLPNVLTLQIGKAKAKETILQLCEWHAVKAIQRKLIHSSKYSKEKREGLTNLVNTWIIALTKEDVDKA